MDVCAGHRVPHRTRHPRLPVRDQRPPVGHAALQQAHLLFERPRGRCHALRPQRRHPRPDRRRKPAVQREFHRPKGHPPCRRRRRRLHLDRCADRVRVPAHRVQPRQRPLLHEGEAP